MQKTTAFASDEQLTRAWDTGLGVAIALVRFDTSFKFADKQSNQTVFIDTEGILDLPDSDRVPVIYGSFRFTRQHAIGFSYFKVNRVSLFIDVDDNLDDVHVTGQATFSDETSLFSMKYINTLYEDNRSHVHALLGLTTLDIAYVLEAEGEISYESTVTGDELVREASVFAPLPLFGLDFVNLITSKWRLNTQISLIAGSYGDLSAWVVDTHINAIYQISKNIGVILGIAYFDADVKIEDQIERADIKYGYDGLVLGIHGVF